MKTLRRKYAIAKQIETHYLPRRIIACVLKASVYIAGVMAFWWFALNYLVTR